MPFSLSIILLFDSSRDSVFRAFFFKVSWSRVQFPTPSLFLPKTRETLGWVMWDLFPFSHQCFNLVAYIWNQLKVKRKTMGIRQANSESWPLISQFVSLKLYNLCWKTKQNTLQTMVVNVSPGIFSEATPNAPSYSYFLLEIWVISKNAACHILWSLHL